MEATRKAALEKGESKYFTGAACVQGHVAPRRAKTGECLSCRTERLFSWRQQNPEKVQKHNQAQYSKFSDKIIAKTKEYYWSNADLCREKSRQYQKKNLHLYAKIKAKRKAAELQRTPAWLTEDDHWMIEQAYELAMLRTKMLGIVFNVDHILPLQGKLVSGLHTPLNMQVIPAAENRRKSNSFEVQP